MVTEAFDRTLQGPEVVSELYMKLPTRGFWYEYGLYYFGESNIFNICDGAYWLTKG